MSIQDDFELSRKLKSLTTSELEKAIANAIGKSVDEEYEVNITGINYNPELNSNFKDASEITFTISRRIDTSWMNEVNKA